MPVIEKGGKKTVFLSSVSPGLGRFQNLLYQAIEQLDDYRCVRMDDFGDDDKASDDFCGALATQCDILMLVHGDEYGCLHAASGKSYAEREYKAAAEAELPRISYTVPEKFEDLHEVQPGLHQERQEAFLARVREDATKNYTAPVCDYGVGLCDLSNEVLGRALKAGLDGIASVAKYTREVKEWRDQYLFPDLRGRVWLLFPFITNTNGWDTGISISNISLDPVGLTKPQGGRARLHFYGGEAPEPQYTLPITSGATYVSLLSSIAPGFQGYLIAECNFYPARGVGLVSRLGGNDPAMYAAEIFHTEPPKKAFKVDGSGAANVGQTAARERLG